MDVNKKIKKWWNELWMTRRKLCIVFVLIALSSVANYYSGWYADNAQSAPANDLILDKIPPTDVTYIFVGYFLFVMALLYLSPLFIDTKRFYYYVAMYSLLALVRSGFIVLTHLQGPSEAIVADYPVNLGFFVFSNDLFFSGHTAIPFLGFLMFKNNFFKLFFLLSSVILGASTLLMHRHYSIDVFAAFFIAYGVYKIGNLVFESNFFKKI